MSKNKKNPLNTMFQNIPQGKRELFFRAAEQMGWSRGKIKVLLENERKGRLLN